MAQLQDKSKMPYQDAALPVKERVEDLHDASGEGWTVKSATVWISRL